MLLIKNGLLFTMNEPEPFYGDLLADKGRLVRVGGKIAATGDMQALRAITVNAAKICRVDGCLGTLEAGKDADIAIFSGSPLDIDSSAVYTVINGCIVWKNEQVNG